MANPSSFTKPSTKPSTKSSAKPFRPALPILLLLVVLLIACGLAVTSQSAAAPSPARGPAPHSVNTAVPSPDHVLLVMEENHSFSEIIGNPQAPYINSLASQGALFTSSHAIEHPSQPNYLDLFSGSNQGVTDDSCPHTFSGVPNLGGELLSASLTFTGYSEGLPSPGSGVCTSGEYARKHVPWTNFTDVPPSDSLPFTSFPSDFSTLPTLGFVIPNLLDDMHDGTIAQGDSWLQQNIDAYKQWTSAHNSLLIVTWDEDDSSQSNQIATIFYGPMVVAGNYSEGINHYNVLRTMEDMYGLPYAGQSGQALPITDVWTGQPSPTPAPPTATPAPCTPGQFTDVPPGSTFYQYVTCLVNAGVISGYSDCTFRPNNNVTRGQLAKTVSNAAGFNDPQTTQLFEDVPTGSTFFDFVGRLASRGYMSGYPCGGSGEPCGPGNLPYFRPNSNATRGQLTKIVSNAAGFVDTIPTSTQTFSDVPPNSAFWLYVERLLLNRPGVMGGYACGGPGEPCDPQNRPYFRPANNVTRGQTSKIVANTFFPNCQVSGN